MGVATQCPRHPRHWLPLGCHPRVKSSDSRSFAAHTHASMALGSVCVVRSILLKFERTPLRSTLCGEQGLKQGASCTTVTINQAREDGALHRGRAVLEGRSCQVLDTVIALKIKIV